MLRFKHVFKLYLIRWIFHPVKLNFTGDDYIPHLNEFEKGRENFKKDPVLLEILDGTTEAVYTLVPSHTISYLYFRVLPGTSQKHLWVLMNFQEVLPVSAVIPV